MSREHDLSNAIDAYLTKAKPKVLKPGTPEHDRAMAEMEAIKAGKPKSTNPAGEESPSAAGSRDKLGERPLVEGIDKQAFSAPQHGPGSEPRGIGTRIRDVAQNTMYATGIKDPAKQPVEERARVGRKARVVVGKREGGAGGREMKNVRQAGQVSPGGVVHYPRDTGQYLKSTDHLDKSLGLEEPSRSWTYQG